MKRVNMCWALVMLISLSMQMVQVVGAPSSIFHVPAQTHNVWAHIPPKQRRTRSHTDVYISKFYESIPTSKGARDTCGRKVPAGDIYGRWNMLALLFGTRNGNLHVASPPCDPFDPDPTQGPPIIFDTNYPTLETAFKRLQMIGTGSGEAQEDRTEDDFFDAENINDGHYSVKIAYDKIGIRGGFQFTSSSGFGVAAKSGFCCYTQKPIFKDRTGMTDPLCPDDPEGPETPSLPVGDQTIIKETLMDPNQRKRLARELGYTNSFECYSTTAPEDTHVQLHWTHPIKFYDEDQVHVIDVTPYIALGAWLPTGKSKDQNIIFSLPTGNDGYTGLSCEGALHFDFFDPGSTDHSMIEIGLGGGVTFFDARDLKNYRVPSSCFQRGIYPWKVDVRRRLGMVWNVYCTMKAEMFIDGLSFYADYVFTKHDEDSFTVCDPDPARAAAFGNGALLLERLSAWKSQAFHLGLDYQVAPHLAIGGGLQSEITGKQVYRTTTLLAQVTFSF